MAHPTIKSSSWFLPSMTKHFWSPSPTPPAQQSAESWWDSSSPPRPHRSLPRSPPVPGCAGVLQKLLAGLFPRLSLLPPRRLSREACQTPLLHRVTRNWRSGRGKPGQQRSKDQARASEESRSLEMAVLTPQGSQKVGNRPKQTHTPLSDTHTSHTHTHQHKSPLSFFPASLPSGLLHIPS